MKKLKTPLVPVQWNIQSYVFVGLLVLLFIAVLRLIAPFFTPLLWAVLLYILLSPLHRRLIRNLNFDTLKGKIFRYFWAGIFTAGTVVIILVPIFLVAVMFFQQVMELGQQAYSLLSERPEYLNDLLIRLSAFIHEISAGQIVITADDIMNQLITTLTHELQRVVLLSGNIAMNVGIFAFSMLIVSFSVFFFYLDGPYLARLTLRTIPIKNEYIIALTTKFKDITRNLFFGYIIVALLQATVAFFVYNIFGYRGSLVFAVITFFLVFIPMIGATMIWVPLGAIRMLSGDIAGGLLFMFISYIFISGIDVVLRPIFLKDRIQLHPLLVFFAILGGIATLGFNGFILGPVLMIFFLTVLDLFLAEHKIGSQDHGENEIQAGTQV